MKLRPLLLLTLCACGDPIADADLSVVLSVEDVSPASAPTTGGTELTIIGKNFAQDARVTIGGAEPTAIEWKSAERLKVITARMTIGPKEILVTQQGQSAKAPEPLIVRLERFTLNDRSDVAAFGMALAADADGDGIDDVFYRGFDAGPWRLARNRDLGAAFEGNEPISPSDFGLDGVAFDANRDGRADLFTQDGRAMLSRADGTYVEALIFAPEEIGATALSSGDFDGDGVKELVVERLAFTGPWFRIIALDRDGHPSGVKELPQLGPDPVLTPIGVGDFNGDGRDDLVVSDVQGVLHLGLGPTLDLRTGWSTVSAGRAEQIEVADLDTDGWDDIVVIGHGFASWYHGLGDGTFEDPVTVPGPCSRWSAYVFAAKDLVLSLCDGDVYSFRAAYRSADWISALSVNIYQNYTLAIGNFDGDPYPDVLVSDARGGTIAYGTSNGLLDRGWGLPLSQEAVALPASFAPGHFAQGDLLAAAGRRLSVIAPGAELPRATVLVRDAAPANFEIVSVAACDIDGDGSDDALVLAQPGPGSTRGGLLELFYSRNGSLEAGESFDVVDPDTYLGSRVLGVDLDGDGRCEPIVQAADRRAEEAISTTAFTRTAGELKAQVLQFGQGLGDPVDLDGDGDVDFYYAQQEAHGIVYFLNDGQGQFTRGSMDITVNVPETTTPMILFDIEIAPGKGGALEVWALATAVRGLPEGHPYFLVHGAFTLGAPLTAMRLSTGQLFGFSAHLLRGDVNGDGVLDVMVARDAAGLRFFTSNASGELISSTTFDGRVDEGGMFYDANGDGILDLLFSNYWRPGTVRVLTTRGE